MSGNPEHLQRKEYFSEQMIDFTSGLLMHLLQTLISTQPGAFIIQCKTMMINNTVHSRHLTQKGDKIISEILNVTFWFRI